MGRWRKVECGTWADGGFKDLSAPQPNGQTLWLYLLTGPRTTTFPGLVVAREAVMADDLGWSVEGFRQAFAEASSKGMAKADWKAGLVVLPKALLDSLGEPRETSRPESPNVLRSWAKSWDEVPDCALKTEYLRQLGSFAEALGEGFGKAYLEAFRKALAKASPHPSPNQEKEKEKEQEKDPSSFSVLPSPEPLVLDLTQTAPAVPAVTVQARQIWEAQENLRADAIPGSRRLLATDDRIERIEKLLRAGTTMDECLEVLKSVAARVRRDQSQAQHFNGTTTWRPENFTRELGRIGSPHTAGPRDRGLSVSDLEALAADLESKGM